jgi:hypothetical protein
MERAPLGVVTKNWRKLVLSDDVPDSRFYTLCTLERLHDGLHRRDIFVPKSERWGDSRAKLLQGDSWQQARSNVCRILNRQADGEKEVKELGAQLDVAYRRADKALAACTDVRIERNKTGRDRLCLTPLDELGEPDSLIDLRRQVDALIPRVDLPEALWKCRPGRDSPTNFRTLAVTGGRRSKTSPSACARC